MLNNKKITSDKGFTIVELLIVIVVIAILAAITIVAYNGIQARSKTTAGQSLANSIVKKAEAYNTVESSYPTYSQLTTNSGNGTAGNPSEAKLDAAAAVVTYTAGSGAAGVDAAATYDDGKKVVYRQVSSSSACVYSWKYDGTAAKLSTSLGGATC